MVNHFRISFICLITLILLIFPSGTVLTQVKAQKSDDLEDIVNIDFRIDVRIFTIMAALNAAGFDFERKGVEMSAVRVAVRDQLKNLDKDLLFRLKSFYRNWSPSQVQTIQSAYTSLALLIQGPPDFAFQKNAPDIPGEALQVTGFSKLLPEFYKKGELEKLWTQYREDYIAEIDKYRPVIKNVIHETVAYFRIPARVILDRQIILIPDLLSFHNVVNARNLEKTYYIIVGPTDDAESNYYQLQHEYLHFLVDPLIQKYGGQLMNLRSLIDLADDQPYMSDEFRGRFLLVVGESLIEALLAHFHPPEDIEAHEVELFRKGFIFAPAFIRALDQYIQSPDIRLPLYLESTFNSLSIKMIDSDEKRIDQIRRRLIRERVNIEKTQQKQLEEQERIQKNQDQFRVAGQLINDGEFEKAEIILNQLLVQEPDNGNIYFYLAQIHGQRKENSKALEFYLKASSSVNVQNWVRAWSFVRAGRHFAAEGKFEEARQMFEQVLRLDGDLRGAVEDARELIDRLPEKKFQ